MGLVYTMSTMHRTIIAVFYSISERFLNYLVYVALACIASYLFYLLRKRNQKMNERSQAYWQRLQEQVLQPDWVFYEKHLQRAVPTAMKELFDNRRLLEAGFAWDRKPLNSFMPLCSNWEVEVDGFDLVPFARIEGEVVFLKPGATEKNAVYIWYHDGGDGPELLCNDITDFVKRIAPEPI